MAYLAIARKWRPQRFEDLVGQAHVAQTLKNAILMERVSHAYLFSGARGTGKTSVARIFAKALRCPNVKEAVPCNVCPECLAIAESRSVDVAEIDGASHNGVEAVRSIRDNVAYSPSSGIYKIYIIDEVHMLSLSAFNALLKTLEEPPAHVIFVLATTEQQKIPMTILSRCQRFEFRRLSQTQILERLQYILREEKKEVAEEGLRTIASHSDGSLRDALSLLDQVLSHGGGQHGPFTDKQVVEALGVNPISSVTAFVAATLGKDTSALLQIIADTYAAGVDLKHFAERCLEELRLLYLMVLAKEGKASLSAEELDLSAGHLAELQRLAQSTPVIQVERMAQLLGKATSQLGWSSLPRFVFEMAAVRMSQLDGLAKIEQVLSGQTIPAAAAAAPAPVPRVAPASVTQSAAPKPATAPPVVSKPAPPREEPPPPLSENPGGPNLPEPPVQMSSGQASTPSWQNFVDNVMKKRPLLGALLCHGEFRLNPDRKAFLSFAQGSFYERQTLEPKNRTDIEDMIKSYFGKDIILAVSAVGAESIKSIEQAKQVEAAALKKSALEHPTVVSAREILGAELVDVKVEV
jgi:DNA polymerase-3 subunit gamma/tau